MNAIITAHGLRLHVATRGAPTGQPLILLHGFTGSATSWGTHLDAFAAAGMYVIAIDLPGHGKSDSPQDPMHYGMAHCQTAIFVVLRELGIKTGQAILLGYSLGGRIALHLAFTGFFRALILESASPGLATAAERAARRASDEALAEQIERDGIPAFVDFWGNISLFASQLSLPVEVRSAQHAQRLNNSPQGLANSLRGVGTGAQPSLWEKLPALGIPTLLITGEWDTKFTAIARQMADLLPGAEMHSVPNAGHAVHFEQPTLFDDMVTAFCHTIKPRRRGMEGRAEHEGHEVHEGP